MPTDPIAKAASLLRNARAGVALTGAGISRPSGIPDFRSESGVWHGLDPFEIASLPAFQRCPECFFDWLRPLLETIVAAKPNPAHAALAQLEARQLVRTVITQNIDGLHQQAGSREVYELHGHLRTAHCLACDREVPAIGVIGEIRRGRVPYCSCGGLFKPDVVLFEEPLPRGLFWLAQRDLERCDLLLVVGTSLEVAPVGDFPLLALRRKVPVIMINLDPTHLDREVDLVIHADAAEALPAICAALDSNR